MLHLRQRETDAGDLALALVAVAVTVTVIENMVEGVEEEAEIETETGPRVVAIGLAPLVAIVIETVEAQVEDIGSNPMVHSTPAPQPPLPPRPTAAAPTATGKRPTRMVLPLLYPTPGIVMVAAVMAINSQTADTGVEVEGKKEDSTLRMATGKVATIREQEEGGTAVAIEAIKTYALR